MSWGIFKIYDWLKGLTTPKWLKDLLEYLTFQVVYPAFEAIGEEAKELLTSLIIKASRKDWSGEKKFKWVVSEFGERWGGDEIKERLINLAIELLVSMLKRQGIIE